MDDFFGSLTLNQCYYFTRLHNTAISIFSDQETMDASLCGLPGCINGGHKQFQVANWIIKDSQGWVKDPGSEAMALVIV